MKSMDTPSEKRSKTRSDSAGERLRSDIREHSKSFKRSWVHLGQALYTVWQDKLFYAWGFDKFEHYVEQEVGLPKQLSVKLLKSYFFLEQEEPSYLKEEFPAGREASMIPGYEAVNILRLAKQNRSLPREDFIRLKRDVFEKGKNAQAVRQDLTALMKQRKVIDPQEERDQRNEAAVRKLVSALETFNKDMAVLKLVPEEIVKQSQVLIEKLEELL